MKREPLPKDLTPDAYLTWLDHQSRRFEGVYMSLCRRGEPCVYCGLFPPALERERKLTRDHIVPKSAGGGHGWENITTACRRCNNKRGVMPFLWFLLMKQLMALGPSISKKQRHAMGFRPCPILPQMVQTTSSVP